MLEIGCTMADVARRLGVHVSTVSRALRQSAGVSAELSQRVRQVAADLGYRPNPLVAALIRSRRNPHRQKFHASLGYLTPRWPAGEHAYRRDYQLLLEGARARADGFGYRLAQLPLGPEGMPSERLSEILTARTIAGLVLPPLHESTDVLAFDWARWPVVAIGYSQRIPVPRVVHDHMQALRLAIARCRERGRRRIGLVLPRRVSAKIEDRWLAAFLLERSRPLTGISLLPPLLLEEKDDQADFRRWRSTHWPDAIIGLPHLTPIEPWLAAAALKVPHDVAVVTLDCHPTGRKYAGIDQDYRNLGGLAVEHLIGLIERRGPKTVLRPIGLTLEGIWRDGSSL
jgi:LacI family transcriptional regulator